MGAEKKRSKRTDAPQRRLRWRQRFIERALTDVEPENYSSEEALALLAGSFDDAKRAYKKAKKRQLVTVSTSESKTVPSAAPAAISTIPRPRRALNQPHRSSVFPPLVPKKLFIESPSVRQILCALNHHDARACLPRHFLDVLATGSGMSWENCAEILFGSKLVTEPIDLGEIAATRAARTFWDLYEQGRARYSLFTANTHSAKRVGDWAHFDHSELEKLLPGILVPTRLTRHDYLTNYVAESPDPALDVYSVVDQSPLFRHRFLQRCNNPLIFKSPLAA